MHGEIQKETINIFFSPLKIMQYVPSKSKSTENHSWGLLMYFYNIKKMNTFIFLAYLVERQGRQIWPSYVPFPHQQLASVHACNIPNKVFTHHSKTEGIL